MEKLSDIQLMILFDCVLTQHLDGRFIDPLITAEEDFLLKEIREEIFSRGYTTEEFVKKFGYIYDAAHRIYK